MSSSKETFTKEQIQEFKEGFALFDKDGDGLIPLYELGKVMRALGVNPTEAELQEMMSEVEGDGDPKIDFDEFLSFMARKFKPTDPIEEVIETFKLFDREGTGLMSCAELIRAIKEIGGCLSNEEVDEMMREAEIDENGNIRYEDFCRKIIPKY